MSLRRALIALLLLGSAACASTVTATRERPGDGGADVALVAVDVPPDPLDDPTMRVDCPPGLPDPCGPGRHCIAVGPGFAGLCVRDGGRGGLCREGPLACDESVPCLDMWCERGNHFSARTTCDDRRCGLNEGCAELDGRLRCLAHGSAGGYCRQAGGPACDPGLRCDAAAGNRRRCGRPLAVGESCVTVGRAVNYCGGDTTCVGIGLTGTCQTLGGPGARCRADSSCDPGLACQLPVGGRQLTCLRPVPEGGACSLTREGAARCAEGTSCNERMGACVRDGLHLGACREATPRCEGPLQCHRQARVCVPTWPSGAACVPAEREMDCVDGTECLVLSPTFEGSVARCVPDGVEGGRCRRSVRPCDPGLACGRGLLCRAP